SQAAKPKKPLHFFHAPHRVQAPVAKSVRMCIVARCLDQFWYRVCIFARSVFGLGGFPTTRGCQDGKYDAEEAVTSTRRAASIPTCSVAKARGDENAGRRRQTAPRLRHGRVALQEPA